MSRPGARSPSERSGESERRLQYSWVVSITRELRRGDSDPPYPRVGLARSRGLRWFAGDGCAQFTYRRMLTLIASPSPMKVNSAAEPPWLIKGSGMPVIGKNPIIMPMLITTWKNKTDAKPAHK